MVSEDTLRRLAPRACAEYQQALLKGEATFERWGITTPERLAAFLATALYETGGLTIVRESMTYTSAARIAAVWPSRFSVATARPFVRNARALAAAVYGDRMGNERNGVQDDDGYRYRGGGFFQTTGYDSYKGAGDAIGVDLAGQPELIEDAAVSLAAACWEASKWHRYADLGERGFRAYSNAINRGNPHAKADPIGWGDRLRWYRKVMDVLGHQAVHDDLIRLGDHGPLVKAYQERLAQLGYAPGGIDGIFGPRTRAAVLAFQAENDLHTDGVIGPQTRAKLNADDARPMPLGDRANDGPQDLAAAGSTTIRAAMQVQSTAKRIAAASIAAGAADQGGVLDWVKHEAGELAALRAVLTTVQGGIEWAASHWYLFVPVVCYFLWRWGGAIIAARLRDHRLGLHLGR
mgnify:CR=1 FL=1